MSPVWVQLCQSQAIKKLKKWSSRMRKEPLKHVFGPISIKTGSFKIEKKSEFLKQRKRKISYCQCKQAPWEACKVWHHKGHVHLRVVIMLSVFKMEAVKFQKIKSKPIVLMTNSVPMKHHDTSNCKSLQRQSSSLHQCRQAIATNSPSKCWSEAGQGLRDIEILPQQLKRWLHAIPTATPTKLTRSFKTKYRTKNLPSEHLYFWFL